MSEQPTRSEYDETDGQPKTARKVRGTRTAIVLVALAAVVAAGVVGVSRLVADDARAASPSAADTTPTAGDPAAAGPVRVSGAGMADQSFGADADTVMAALVDRLGEPDLTLGPQRYFRIPGHDGWFEDAGDPISLSWQYPVTSVSCWHVLCAIFGGDDAEALRLRGWEVATYRVWSELDESEDVNRPDVRLAHTGLGLGDSWKKLHSAYPRTVIRGAEGASLAVGNTPWPAVSDGVAGWRLSGPWDFSHPSKAPAGAVVTRLSGGEGPEPGCC